MKPPRWPFWVLAGFLSLFIVRATFVQLENRSLVAELRAQGVQCHRETHRSGGVSRSQMVCDNGDRFTWIGH